MQTEIRENTSINEPWSVIHPLSPEDSGWTAPEAEKALSAAGFVLFDRKAAIASTRRGARRVVVPFHAGAILHPKIVNQTLEAIEEMRNE